MTETVTVFTLASVVILTGCPKKDDAADAAAEAAAAANTATATADTATAADSAATATAAPTGGGKSGTTVKPTDAGAEGGATDAGSDAGAVQECCCDVAGKKEMAGQSACVKDKKGTCVKKELCAADAGGGASTATDAGAGAVQQCCCDANGKKELVGQSACVKERKGACVKMDQCKPK